MTTRDEFLDQVRRYSNRPGSWLLLRGAEYYDGVNIRLEANMLRVRLPGDIEVAATLDHLSIAGEGPPATTTENDTTIRLDPKIGMGAPDTWVSDGPEGESVDLTALDMRMIEMVAGCPVRGFVKLKPGEIYSGGLLDPAVPDGHRYETDADLRARLLQGEDRRAGVGPRVTADPALPPVTIAFDTAGSVAPAKRGWLGCTPGGFIDDDDRDSLKPGDTGAGLAVVVDEADRPGAGFDERLAEALTLLIQVRPFLMGLAPRDMREERINLFLARIDQAIAAAGPVVS